MIIFGIQNNKNFKLFLPEIIDGDFIVTDTIGNQIGNIKANQDKWVIYPSFEYSLLTDNGEVESLVVEDYIEFYLKNKISGNVITIFSYPTYETNALEYNLKKSEIRIGSDPSCDVCFSSPKVKGQFAKITFKDERWYLECEDNCFAFVDGRLAKKKRLLYGETIFIYGLKIICICDFIVFINCVKSHQLKINEGSFIPRSIVPQEIKETSFKVESESESLDKNDEFYRSPRFRTQVERVGFQIKGPGQKQEQPIQPAILTVGPQLTMILTSLITMSTTISQVIHGAQSFSAVATSLIISIVAMVSALLWPALTRRYNKKTQVKAELRRVKNYRKYLERMDKEVSNVVSKQKQIIVENSISLEECQQIIFNKKRNLWERTINDNDFLTVRVGTGFVKPEIDFEVDDEETDATDILVEEMHDFVRKYDTISDTPLNVSFIDNRISAVVGNYGVLQLFFENILLQLMTFHMYNELKIVVFSNEVMSKNWDYLKFSPHCWDNNKQKRFICESIEEKKQISTYLENIFKSRLESIDTNGDDKGEVVHDEYKKFNCYYLIIIDDIKSCRNLEIINMILKSKENLGFSILIKNDRISNLPSECSTFFNITDTESGMFKNNLNEDNQLKFKAELNKTVNIETCIKKMANIYVNVPKDAHELPKSVGFMEMYGVGNVDQFNSQNRWVTNNPVTSLSVPVGIDQQGELFNFDIHEKAQGPHGLVAGTTGSGKSEWIITYILSLCVNFSPLEVQFVLIDYKGGGLAGSFVNEETGMRLPHLVGTITNLDKSEIRRSLASLEAESKRRQRMFNEAREKLNDSSMNIYKYQQYYRKGMLDEPLSHLFIISDEFAELKSQEPEFLDQLVSIARIGRSLGIHLILATQKPAGVVDEQMWSNSRFKICLRVQDKSDSQDMIKCDDAAYLHQTGAFYLQVGLNEVFALGQSAYAGAKYKPTSVLKKNIDTSVDVLDNIGKSINSVDYIEPDTMDNSNVHGEELLNIILYVSDVAKKQNLTARKLWLDAMPETIYVDNLKKQFGFKRVPYNIRAIIGEYDDPYRQYQGLLDIGINGKNTFIVGQTGSGKEQMLQTIIYSIMTNYLPQEVMMYICDFGAETLAMFENSPHVGDIVYSKSKTKIFNLFKYLKKILNERRNKYRDAGGSFEAYNKTSQSKDPLILTVINNVSFLKESYEEQLLELEMLISEGSKYGISFIEADNDIASHKGKIFETFENKLCLKVNDYSNILGNKVNGINPKELKGRGLIVVNEEGYEFQTAKICDESAMQKTVRFICDKFYEAYKYKNPKIPKIPNPVNYDVIKYFDININNVCVGYSILNLEPIYFDLQKNVSTLIVGTKKSQIKSFFRVFNKQLDTCVKEGTKVYLFDPEEVYKVEGYQNITYVPQSEIVNTINNLLIYINNEYTKFNSMENKNEYKPANRNLLVFHSISIIFAMIGYNMLEQLSIAFDHALELKLFDFVIADNILDFKEVQREPAITHLFAESNGICISQSFDTQMTLDIGSKDFKTRESLLDKEGYAVTLGKGKYIQVLQTDADDEEEE